MSEEQILNSMTPEELINYMNLIEECTVVIEEEYKKERESLKREG